MPNMKNQTSVNNSNHQILTNRINQDFSPVLPSNRDAPYIFISSPSSDIVYQSQVEFDQSNIQLDVNKNFQTVTRNLNKENSSMGISSYAMVIIKGFE
jgi:hypothetical protein